MTMRDDSDLAERAFVPAPSAVVGRVPAAGDGHCREARALQRRRVYLGEALTFEIRSGAARLDAEAIDLTLEGLGLAVVGPLEDGMMPQLGEVVAIRYTGPGASGVTQEAVVRHRGCLRTARRTLPCVGLSLVPDTARGRGREGRDELRHRCPDALPAFATASCPWFFRERLRFRILELGAGGMTLRTSRLDALLLPRSELDLELHLAFVGVGHARGRLTWVRRDDAKPAFELGISWIDPPRPLLKMVSRYLLAGDETLTPAGLRASGLPVGSVECEVTYDYAASSADYEQIRALRLHAHQAEGHLVGACAADMRSTFDSHARHLTCRFGGRIVGYVRVIFVDGVASRSQYVAIGGHEVPQWLWDAGFVEAGAGAVHPGFQRAGLFVPLMVHSLRVAVQSGHRFVLGACDDDLLGMYREMGFECLETRMVEPKPGWRFRSHLIFADAERLLQDPPASRTAAAMARVIEFASRAAGNQENRVRSPSVDGTNFH
jgi:hypothetical protein